MTAEVEARHLSRMACCHPVLPAKVTSYVIDGLHIIECQCGAMWNGTVESFHVRLGEMEAVLDALDRMAEPSEFQS